MLWNSNQNSIPPSVKSLPRPSSLRAASPGGFRFVYEKVLKIKSCSCDGKRHIRIKAVR